MTTISQITAYGFNQPEIVFSYIPDDDSVSCPVKFGPTLVFERVKNACVW